MVQVITRSFFFVVFGHTSYTSVRTGVAFSQSSTTVFPKKEDVAGEALA